MITHRHSLIATLALTLLLTVGAESSYAQKGRFRGLSNRSSSLGGGNNNAGSGFKLGRTSGLNLSKGGNASSLQTFSGGSPTTQKSFGKFNGGNNNIQKQSNPLLGISRNHLNQSGRNNGGNLQKILGNSKPGGQTLGGAAKKDGHFGQKLDRLQNVFNKDKGQGGNLQSFGKHNHDKGHAGKLLHLIQHNQKHGKVCLDHKTWCHTKPQKCHWWYHYCKPLAYCEPHHHVHCKWQYVTCDHVVNGQVVQADARWYLGLKGLLLPGQGVGVEEVAAGSPAAAVGLQPGMVITRCNGIDMVDEAALGQAIAQSGGVLQMDLLLAEGTPATCVVVMQQVTSLSF